MMMERLMKAVLMLLICLRLSQSMSKEEKHSLKEKALEMFHHAFRNYMTHAYPADELMPLSCRGRYRGTEASRGDVDDTLGNFSLSLIDSLDTLVVLGEIDLFEESVLKLISDVSFDNDIVVSVFETNIRVLGGLLGGHLMAEHVRGRMGRMGWYGGELLKMAEEVANRLLPAFNTSTGIPYPRVNLRHGVKGKLSRTGVEKDTCTACAGTMILELSALSRLTGNKIYELKATKAMDYLWHSRHKSSDLMGVVIDINNGDWVRKESGVGAGIDSYYEYLLKAYIMLGDDMYLDRFNTHYKAIMKYISNGAMMLDVHMHRPSTNSRNFMDALLAFWPGLQVLKGDLKPAIELHEMLYQVMQRHNFIPEAFTSDFRVHWAQHPLRPEFLESTYFLYKATGDDHYLEVGREVMGKMDKLARSQCGFASIKDVTTGALEDQMDSFVFAETFKYLYLLFSEKEDMVVDVDEYIFTTEAHLLPLFLSPHHSNHHPKNSTVDSQEQPESASKITLSHQSDEGDEDDSCPSRVQVDYARDVRSPLKNMVEKLCPKPLKNRPSRLRASEFIAGDQEQLQRLAVMGIRLVTKEDGRVQLVHMTSQAVTSEDSHEGMLFIQEMIELSKTHAEREPRVVQLLSAPMFGSVVLEAGPAQFGGGLSGGKGVEGVAVMSTPGDACSSILNDVRGKIVVVQRGGCMFIEKARHVQDVGGIAVVIIDNTEGSSSSTGQFFSMSGDGRDDVTIPALFLFHHDALVLLQAAQANPLLVLRLAQGAKKTETVLIHHLLAKNIYSEVDVVIERSLEGVGGGGKEGGADDGDVDQNGGRNGEVRGGGEEGDQMAYHHAKVNRTLFMSLEYLGLGALMGVVSGGRGVEVGVLEGEKVGDGFGVGSRKRLRLSQRKSEHLSSLLNDQFPVRVIRQLVPPYPPVDYFSEDGGGVGDGGQERNHEKDEVIGNDKDHKSTDDNNSEKEISSKVHSFLTQPSEHLQMDVRLALTHLITILHHCSDFATHHLTMTLSFTESTEALARLVEFTFTEGRMMFGVETERQLGAIARSLKVKEDCMVDGGSGADHMESRVNDVVDDVMKEGEREVEEVLKENDGDDGDSVGKGNRGGQGGGDDDDAEVIRSFAEDLNVDSEVVEATLERYVEEEVGRLFGEMLKEERGEGKGEGGEEGGEKREGRGVSGEGGKNFVELKERVQQAQQPQQQQATTQQLHENVDNNNHHHHQDHHHHHQDERYNLKDDL